MWHVIRVEHNTHNEGPLFIRAPACDASGEPLRFATESSATQWAANLRAKDPYNGYRARKITEE
jgi:hypothetical protein